MKKYDVRFHITVWGTVLNVPGESEEAALLHLEAFLAEHSNTWERFSVSIDAHDADAVTDGKTC